MTHNWQNIPVEVRAAVKRVLVQSTDFASLAALRMTCRRERSEGVQVPHEFPKGSGSSHFVMHCYTHQHWKLLYWGMKFYPDARTAYSFADLPPSVAWVVQRLKIDDAVRIALPEDGEMV